ATTSKLCGCPPPMETSLPDCSPSLPRLRFIDTPRKRPITTLLDGKFQRSSNSLSDESRYSVTQDSLSIFRNRSHNIADWMDCSHKSCGLAHRNRGGLRITML